MTVPKSCEVPKAKEDGWAYVKEYNFPLETPEGSSLSPKQII